MTVPRDLRLEKMGEKFLLASKPVAELNTITEQAVNLESNATASLTGPATLHLKTNRAANFSITLSNELGQKLLIGYDKATNNYFIDRTQSGKVNFEKDFAARHTAPRFSPKETIDLTLIIDKASVELFADDGLTVMTAIFFPDTDYSRLAVQAAESSTISSVQMSRMKSIYK